MKTPTQPTIKRSYFRSVACICSLVTAFALAFCLPFDGAVADQGQPAQQAQDKAATKLPVILLTGFEPFGEYKRPNPSWEGIKALDGQHWKGYQLVCKQLPVVWGEPLKQLQTWIPEYQPVAILSFGQGGKGCFALEGVASNKRSPEEDNRGERPPAPMIVGGGQTRFRSTLNCEKVADIMSEKGHATRVSMDAGNYLCEEALYSLEYLKATKQLDATVLFCHVPPLDTPVAGKKLTAEHVQAFVKDMLETWHTLHESKALAPRRQRPEDPRQQEIKEFIGRYFRTWSEQDMDGYGDCFLPEAAIQFVDSRSRLTTYSRQQFVANQRDYHRTAPHKATEVAESIDIRFETKLARVVVYWKLTAGPRTELGYDHFTLIKQDGKWRIVNLVFYATAGGA